MRRVLTIAVAGAACLLWGDRSSAQFTAGPGYPAQPVQRVNAAIGLNGLYGTSWGMASFGVPRTYTTFSSPYGGGYGYGYPNYGFLPGRYGVGLWRAGFTSPGYVYGSANGYNTFPYPYNPGGPRYGPPIGVYAPAFGPSLPASLISN
jgi:hypothetical protein